MPIPSPACINADQVTDDVSTEHVRYEPQEKSKTYPLKMEWNKNKKGTHESYKKRIFVNFWFNKVNYKMFPHGLYLTILFIHT